MILLRKQKCWPQLRNNGAFGIVQKYSQELGPEEAGWGPQEYAGATSWRWEQGLGEAKTADIKAGRVTEQVAGPE